MLFQVVGIEVNQVPVFVGLLVLDECLVLVKREILTFHVFQQTEILGPFIEVFLRQHTVVDEDLQVVPFLLILLSVLLEDTIQAVGHFLGNVSTDLLHVAVALQVASAHIQRNVGRVDHTMKQGEELRNDSFYLVGNEHLIAIQLYLIALDVDIVLDTREVENTCEVERIVNIQVNPEQRLVHLHGVEGTVEALIVIFFQRTWCLCPERLYTVDDMILFRLHLLTVFPFGLLTEGNGYRQELTILVQQLFNLVLFKEFLAVVINIEDDITTAVIFLSILNGKLRTAVAAPFHRFGSFLITLGDNLHLLGYHKRRIEA